MNLQSYEESKFRHGDKSVFAKQTAKFNTQGITTLFSRANMETELNKLGPLLSEANLTLDSLTSIYNEGEGIDAVLQLLEKQGLTSTKHQMALVRAIGVDTQVMFKITEPIKFLALQGSASYLWIGLNLDKSDVPVPRPAFLALLRQKLLKLPLKMNNKDVQLAANCIMGNLTLCSPLAGGAAMLYSKRKIRSAKTERDIPTQVWAGYLAKLDDR